ncbi:MULTISPECIES: hypothetical protein [Streptomyces]|nr:MULTISPECIES: hypothetical protein [Streptomyces]
MGERSGRLVAGAQLPSGPDHEIEQGGADFGAVQGVAGKGAAEGR